MLEEQTRPFYLVAVRNGEFIELPGEAFENGERAEERASALAGELGCKVQPRRRAAAPDWRERQRRRLQEGFYTPPPEGWDLAPVDGHFLHLSKRDARKLAFTESPEKGEQDKTTQIKPGRYLERYYPALGIDARRRYIAMVDPPPPVSFATTAEEIERVYTNGPQSCMSGPACDYASHCHPTHIYADSDFAVAYLAGENGRVTARVLVETAKRAFPSLIYGDRARMELALAAAGYRPARSYAEFEGSRIRIIENENNPSEIVITSLDFGPWDVSPCGRHLFYSPSGCVWGSTCGSVPKPDALRRIEREHRGAAKAQPKHGEA